MTPPVRRDESNRRSKLPICNWSGVPVIWARALILRNRSAGTDGKPTSNHRNTTRRSFTVLSTLALKAGTPFGVCRLIVATKSDPPGNCAETWFTVSKPSVNLAFNKASRIISLRNAIASIETIAETSSPLGRANRKGFFAAIIAILGVAASLAVLILGAVDAGFEAINASRSIFRTSSRALTLGFSPMSK